MPEAQTIADGIAVKRPGGITLPLIRDLVDEVVLVSDDEIARGIVYLLQNLRLVAEGAGAAGVAALLAGKVLPRGNETICAAVCGGNIDANFLARVIEQVLVQQGRYIVIHTSVPDRPGNLARMINFVADEGANMIDIAHRRAAWQVPVDRTGIEMILEVRDEQHGQAVISRLEAGRLCRRSGRRRSVSRLMIRLIATDIDGTLLDSDNSVPDAHRRALAEAVERGVLLALVTARKRDSSMAVARALELPCACISHNGARTWDWNGNELRHLKLDLGLAREIVTFADQRELPLVVTIDERNYYDRRYPMSPSLLGSDERIEASLIDILTAEPTRIIAAGGKIDDLVDAFSAAHDSIQAAPLLQPFGLDRVGRRDASARGQRRRAGRVSRASRHRGAQHSRTRRRRSRCRNAAVGRRRRGGGQRDARGACRRRLDRAAQRRGRPRRGRAKVCP